MRFGGKNGVQRVRTFEAAASTIHLVSLGARVDPQLTPVRLGNPVKHLTS